MKYILQPKISRQGFRPHSQPRPHWRTETHDEDVFIGYTVVPPGPTETNRYLVFSSRERCGRGLNEELSLHRNRWRENGEICDSLRLVFQEVMFNVYRLHKIGLCIGGDMNPESIKYHEEKHVWILDHLANALYFPDNHAAAQPYVVMLTKPRNPTSSSNPSVTAVAFYVTQRLAWQ